MMNYDYSSPVAQPEYHAQFWEMARHNTGKTNFLDKGHVLPHGTYTLPTVSSGKLEQALDKTSLF